MKLNPRIALAAAAIAAVGIVGVATTASAHNFVVSTTPTEGETLTELPDRFDITTNDTLLDVTGNADAFVFDITDADGLYYGDGCISVEGTAMYTDAALGEAGTYTIAYQLVSADGHSFSGEYDFEWAPAEGQPVSVGWDTPAECGVERTPEPSAEPSAEPTEEPSATPSEQPADSQDSAAADDWLWIGGVAALVVAGVALLALLRRRK